MKCADCPDYKACRRQNDLRRRRHKCKKANEPFVQTNADRIRAMSDEELAWELMTWRIETCARLNGAESPYPHTQKSILDWLQQPVKDGDDE